MDAPYYKDLIDSLSSKISIKTRNLEKYKDYLPKVQRLIANVSPIALYCSIYLFHIRYLISDNLIN